MFCGKEFNENFKPLNKQKPNKQIKKTLLHKKSKISAGSLKGTANILTLLKFLRQWLTVSIIENFYLKGNYFYQQHESYILSPSTLSASYFLLYPFM